jgi:ABC-2 type transport system ATP-binding protein
LREFIGEYNRRTGATIILTSHYMQDVEALCSRLMVIHHGKLLYDGPLSQLVQRIAPFKLVKLTLEPERTVQNPDLPAGAEIIEQDGAQMTIRTSRHATPSVTAQLLNTLPIIDLTVEEPAIEAVIDQIYTDKSVSGHFEASNGAANVTLAPSLVGGA